MSEAIPLSTNEQEILRKHLAHHFDTPQQQFESGKLGMWLFLATELLLFSGLFCAYAVYRALHPDIFRFAAQWLDWTSGLINTLVLLSSGFTMAWGIRLAQMGKKKGLAVCLILTMTGGLTFLAIHGYEYFDKYRERLLWGTLYNPDLGGNGKPVLQEASAAPLVGGSQPARTGDWPLLNQLGQAGYIVSHSDIAPAADGPSGIVQSAAAEPATLPPVQPYNVQIFFGIYFIMTGLHSFHVIVGVGLMTWLLIRTLRNDFGPTYYAPVDYVGLYWGIVDMIWMFLFPLLYLIH
ncbi:MAG TPA: cytochrome c oxidase subunit 3 [Phycisphaerae bacterium]|nr:cytochrome c oxidase subunit 3 [Phycisphaerae bacterium]